MKEDTELIENDELEPIAGSEEAEISTVVTARPMLIEGTDGGKVNYGFYLLLPALFLSVSLLGGLRFALDGSLVFVVPPLACLIFGALTLVLFVRAGMIDIGAWFSESAPTLGNISHAGIMLVFYMALVQVYNSLLPEEGLPFWIVGFCFFWTLWNAAFAEYDSRRLVQSLGGLFLLAFIVKYMFLLNLTPESSGSWSEYLSAGKIAKEAAGYLLSLPGYGSATGYAQFFVLVLFGFGLFLLPAKAPGATNAS